MNLNKLIDYLEATDADLLERLVHELLNYEYRIFTDYENFVFAVPLSKYVTPLLYMAHIDTRRDPDYPPVIKRLGESLININHKSGCLGADDRAGVFIVMEMLNKLEHLPYVLFTTGEESGFTGAYAFTEYPHPELKGMPESFWKDKLIWEPYVEDIYAIVHYDRCGYNHMVIYEESKSFLSTCNTLLGYGYELHNSVSWGTDSHTIATTMLRARVNLSAGFLREHTINETLLLPAAAFAINNGITVANIVTKDNKPHIIPKHAYSYYTNDNDYFKNKQKEYLENLKKKSQEITEKELTNNVETSVTVDTSPVCDICGKSRTVTFVEHADLLICNKCINRAGGDVNKISYASVEILKHELDILRKNSGRNNNKNMPLCPVNTCHEDIEPINNGFYYCNECYTTFFPDDDYVTFWQSNEDTIYRKSLDPSENEVRVITDKDDVSNIINNCTSCGRRLPNNELYAVYDVDDSFLGNVCQECLDYYKCNYGIEIFS